MKRDTTREHLPLVPVNLIDQDNQKKREYARTQLQGFNILLPQDPIEEPKQTFNNILLSEGEHGGARLTRPFTRLVGVPGTKVTRKLIIEQDAIVENIHFVGGSDNNKDYLCIVSGSATVIFKNNIWEKRVGDHGSTNEDHEQCWVLVAEKASANFIGNVFTGSIAPASYVVSNLNAAATVVNLVGCINKTGKSHNNVTLVADLND